MRLNRPVNRTTYHIIVEWCEGKADLLSVESEQFASARQFYIDQGFRNLHTEWYEGGAGKLPELIRVFVYWEDPDTSPSYDQLRVWGSQGTTQPVEKAD